MTQQKRIEKLEVESGMSGQKYFTDDPIERRLAAEAGHDPDSLTHHQALQCGSAAWLASLADTDDA